MKTKIILALFVQVFAFTLCLAQEDVGSEDKPSLKTGRLAGVGTFGLGEIQTGNVWSVDPADGGKGSPVVASIRRDGKQWIMNISNKSEDQYTANLRITQYDKTLRKILTNSATVTLRAGQSAERRFKAHVNAINATVDLVNWSAKEKDKTEEDLNAQIEAKQNELKKLQKEAGIDMGEDTRRPPAVNEEAK